MYLSNVFTEIMEIQVCHHVKSYRKPALRGLAVALSLLYGVLAVSGQNLDAMLRELDKVIADRQVYLSKRQKLLWSLKSDADKLTTDKQRYEAYGRLLEEYKSYDIDSSAYFANEKYAAAKRLGNLEYVNDATMNIANMMGINGMYKEALDYISTVRQEDLKDYQMAYFFHIYRIVYGLMADNCADPNEKKRYEDMTERYRDSILVHNDRNSFNYMIVLADKYNVNRKYGDAIKLIASAYSRFADTHEKALMDYTLSEAYHGLADEANEEKYLIRASVNDIKSGVLEYVALRKLAVLLYKQGDIDRAYVYMTRCLNDAQACNSRWRIYEVQQAFPIINKAYHEKLDSQNRLTRILLASVTLLAVFLLVALFHIRRQMKKVASARKGLQEANSRLTELNRELSENSHIKEEYIGHYMDQCSLYIDKLDTYRKHLLKVASKEKVSDLLAEIRSTRLIDDELKEFYANFDESFLSIFPDFVTEFNSLLQPDRQIHLKPNEKLNTELRIFALVRLGIGSSTKIAKFLRYSVTTIYNYRVRVRNCACIDRDRFDDAVMQIGLLNTSDDSENTPEKYVNKEISEE